jgi:hypothetical protein
MVPLFSTKTILRVNFKLCYEVHYEALFQASLQTHPFVIFFACCRYKERETRSE